MYVECENVTTDLIKQSTNYLICSFISAERIVQTSMSSRVRKSINEWREQEEKMIEGQVKEVVLDILNKLSLKYQESDVAAGIPSLSVCLDRSYEGRQGVLHIENEHIAEPLEATKSLELSWEMYTALVDQEILQNVDERNSILEISRKNQQLLRLIEVGMGLAHSTVDRLHAFNIMPKIGPSLEKKEFLASRINLNTPRKKLVNISTRKVLKSSPHLVPNIIKSALFSRVLLLRPKEESPHHKNGSRYFYERSHS